MKLFTPYSFEEGYHAGVQDASDSLAAFIDAERERHAHSYRGTPCEHALDAAYIHLRSCINSGLAHPRNKLREAAS